MRYWANAQHVFPEYFQGDLLIVAIRVTPAILEQIRFHQSYGATHLHPYQNNEPYMIGDYVGKVIRHVMEPIDESNPADILYTPMSYYSHSAAMYEASMIAQDAIQTVVRHMIHLCYPVFNVLPTHPSVDIQTSTILETGVNPYSDSARAPES
mgnify:CR=1 FL=1